MITGNAGKSLFRICVSSKPFMIGKKRSAPMRAGRRRWCFFDGRPTVLGLTADVKVSIASEEFTNRFANCRMVIDDQH